MPNTTLQEQGIPWAEIYLGNMRFTGVLQAYPEYQDSGEAEPNWVWVGDLTPEEFWHAFDQDVHDTYHSPERADKLCKFCKVAGWTI